MYYFFYKETTMPISFVIFLLLVLGLNQLVILLLNQMLTIGERLIQLRKAKNWSQEDLAHHTNSSRIMIGKYERNDHAPSIEVLRRLAKAFQVSIDFIIGEGEFAAFDKEILNRIEAIEKLDNETKKHLLFLIDNVVQNVNAKKAFSK
jgi:transcriptional regulator with XRE-family HTH domain